jgi:hypothetical protein
MNKVVRDGRVAVLVSSGHGTGWYTLNREYKECLYHPDIIALVERGATPTAIENKAEELWPDGLWIGAEGLEVKWIPQGYLFDIFLYEAGEYVVTERDHPWQEA